MTGEEPFHIRVVGRAYRGMLPWMAGLWIAATLLPGPAGRHVLILFGASPFFLAAGAHALGFHPGSTRVRLAVHRAFSHLTALAILVAISALAAAVGGTIGAILADFAGLSDDRPLSIPFAILAAFPIAWSRWPAAALTFAVPESAGAPGSAGRAWYGPGFGAARRLLLAAGDPRNSTLILATFLLWALTLTLVGASRPAAPLRVATDFLTYFGFLPLLSTMMLLETRRMVDAVGNGGSDGVVAPGTRSGVEGARRRCVAGWAPALETGAPEPRRAVDGATGHGGWRVGVAGCGVRDGAGPPVHGTGAGPPRG
jgi:hypothetical protein